MLNPLGWLQRGNSRRREREPITVILWSKSGCCLCERAHKILSRLAKDYPLQIEERDITTDPIAFERYCYTIPVVEIAGGQKFQGKITEFWLRRALADLQDR